MKNKTFKGVHRKPIQSVGLPKKGGGLRQFTNLGRGLARKTGGGGIFEGERVDTPMHTMNTIKNILGYLLEKKVHQYQ